MRFFFTLLAFVLLSAPVSAQIPTTLSGAWEGRAQVRSQSAPEGITVRLAIAADGQVAGSAGDAIITNGRVKARGPIGRVFNLGTQYLIEGELHGALIAIDNIARRKIRMPVDVDGRRLIGDLNAMGDGSAISVRMELARP